MLDTGVAPNSRVWVFLFVSGDEPVIGGSVLRVRHPFPVGTFVRLNVGTVPLCAWEDEDDPSYAPEDLYKGSSYGDLDDDEGYGPREEEDEFNEEEEEEEDEDEDFDDDEDDEDYDEDDEDYDEEDEF